MANLFMKNKIIESIKFIFKKDEGAKSANLLIRGKFATCIILSLVSAFIDIVFFSGLSKSGYPFANIVVPASVLLSIMSIGFSSGKFFVAMQLSAIKEIQTRLVQMGYEWAKESFKLLKIKWNAVHKFLISISIITSVSLSTITIGNGVRTMEQNIKSMSSDETELIALKEKRNQSDSTKDASLDKQLESVQKSMSNESNAEEYAQNEIAKYNAARSNIDKIRAGRLESELSAGELSRIGEIKRQFRSDTGWNLDSTDPAKIREHYLSSATSQSSKSLEEYDAAADAATKRYEERIAEKIVALNEKDYHLPDGTPLVFTNENGEAINIDNAISKLEKGIMQWQVDTGDAGASSKVFQLLATYVNAPPTAGGMGFSEVIMMLLIMVFGIVQEFLIAIFTPKSIVSRKMIFQFSEYMGKDFDANRFMLQTYIEYLNNGVISTEAFEEKTKKCVRAMDTTIDSVIEKWKNSPEQEKRTRIPRPKAENKKVATPKLVEERDSELQKLIDKAEGLL